MILALLMAAALSAADGQSPAPVPAPPTAVERLPVAAPLKPGEKRIKMICVTDAKPGSRFTQKTCYPLDEWKARMENARQVVSDYQMAPQMNPGR
ncbi:hypothetical protein [Phenylobacterium sp.]|uniref:hypothetical protein n=1 Tax=Phenylobacterium sp. TaxID=1871053 RepID=UPI002721B11B|nr:hypothetical protein [Phenylobacterium sp.]MDO8379943.1 hypothetical protein [Phenylobacterium sp.]